MTTPEPEPASLSFDEYKMYYESAERVTDRRHDMNKWNYSIMVATLLAVGGVLVWATSSEDHELLGILGVVMLSIMAALHCSYWIKQIDDFKALNSEKFNVLNEMAPHVRFQAAGPYDQIRSFEPFRREWEGLIEDNALHELNRTGLRRMVVLKSSGAEYFIPRAFRFLFVLVAAGTLIIGTLDRNSIKSNISPFPHSTTTTTRPTPGG